MKKRKKIGTVVISLCISLLIVAFSVITVLAYSTDDDPLITLSYLNEVVIPNLKKELGGSSTQTPAPSTEKEPSTEVSQPVTAVQSASYELLELTIGQTVTFDSASEIIVRPGSIVTTVSPFPKQGLCDITNGNELLNGDEISINAYIVVPRGGDGRGIYVNSEKAYVLIRGEYNIG